MIKPKYKKGMDFSQIARSTVEQAIGGTLTPLKNAKSAATAKKRKKQNQN